MNSGAGPAWFIEDKKHLITLWGDALYNESLLKARKIFGEHYPEHMIIFAAAIGIIGEKQNEACKV